MVHRAAYVILSLLVALCQGVTVQSATPSGELTPEEASEYYELFSVLVDTLDQVERNYVKDIDRQELLKAAIDGVLKKLDPYSSYISPDEMGRFRREVESRFGGIGIQIGVERGVLKIVSPLVDTPASRAGLRSGDRIVEIEGEPTDGISIDGAIKKLKGEAGTDVTISVLHPGSAESESVTLTREVIRVPTVLGDTRRENGTWDYMLDPELGIGYVRMTTFSRGTRRELERTLRDLKDQGMRGLILDLRFNPGGLLSSAIKVCDMFIADGRIVSTEGRNSEPRSWEATKAGTFDDFPMVVLLNRYSASASEIVAACLQDHGRAVVVGERSWGKGSVQNVVELEGGRSALKLTTASYKRPSGKNIHRFPDAKESDEWGVTPDEGFRIRLSGSEMGNMAMLFGNGEVRKTVKLPGKDDAQTPSESEDVESSKNGEPPADEKADDAPDDEPKSESSADDEPQDAEQSEGDSEDTSSEDREERSDTSGDKDDDENPHRQRGKLVDRQLQRAVDHVVAELTKAESP